MTDKAWLALSDREQDAKVAEALDLPFVLMSAAHGQHYDFGSGTLAECLCFAAKINVLYSDKKAWQYHPMPKDRYTTTWSGAGLVVCAMPGYNFDIKTAPTSTLVICGKGGGMVTYDAIVDGPPDRAVPSAITLAAVRALKADG